MENKLQQLTEKLYNDGLNKGKVEADALVAQAQSEADAIVIRAKAEAETIIEQAKKNAAEQTRASLAELKLASQQTITRVRQSIEQTIKASILEPAVAKAFNETEFVKDLIKLVVAQHPESSSIILPIEAEKNFDTLFRKGLETTLADKEILFDKNVKSGFKIKIQNQGYIISFTDKDFAELFKAHIHSKLSELLFE